MQWFNTLRSIDLFPLELACIADISISFRPSEASAKDVRGKKEQECYAGYNTCHKSLKQKPFVFNFLRISYIHSSHLCSHSNVPLSFPNVEPPIFWSTEMTAIPNQHWGGENHTSVSRFMMSIVGLSVWLCILSLLKQETIGIIFNRDVSTTHSPSPSPNLSASQNIAWQYYETNVIL